MDILFKNATIVTMDEKNPVFYDACLGVTGRKIVLLSEEEIAAKASRVMDCKGKVIMPGLYNCHTHAAMTLFRGYANDRALEDWLFNFIFPAEKKLTPGLIKTATTLAAAEMIAGGTVSFSDMYYFMDTVADVAYETGMLANVSNAVVGMDKDTYDFHKDNVYGQTLNAIEKYLGEKDGRVKIDASIHAVYTSHPKAWAQVMDFCHKFGLDMHVHLSETKTEHEGCIKTYGRTPAKVFYDNGVFDVRTLCAHGVWVTDEDIGILAEKCATVVHNPLSNLKLASGLAPIDKLLKGGVNVAIGTDSVSSNNSHNLFEEIKMASLLQKYATNDPTAMPAFKTLQLATTSGARAQGRTECGMLKEGFDADLIVIDFDNPRQTVCYDPVLNLAYSTSDKDVELTMVRGKILYEKGDYKTIDMEKILHEAKKAKTVFQNL